MDIVAIIFGIVSSVLSAMLIFMWQSSIKENKRLKKEKELSRTKHETAMENGMVCVLRKHLMDEHEIWTERGYITSHALENGLSMYRAYKDLGGNGMIDHMEEEIQALPIRD